MVRQNKSKKTKSVGKGNITPVQVAFIVDRYLSDNSYTETRSIFRSEASDLLSKSPVNEAPKSLLTLGAMLEEYITLKEQKLLVDQERCCLEQEKLRVYNLLKGMQNVMNVYNSCGNPVFSPLASLGVASGATVSQADNSTIMTHAGNFPMNNTPAMMSASRPLTIEKDSTNFHTPVPSHVATKRKVAKNVLDRPINSKKSRSSAQPKGVKLGTQKNNNENNQEKSVIASTSQPSVPDDIPKRSPVQGSNVVKCLFSPKHTSSPPNTSVSKTPPRASSSETEKSISPVETCSTAKSNKDTTPQQIISTNCTIISSETIRVSPNKQIAYYSIEKNRYISTCSPVKTNLKRSNVKDHVKGRLDFGASDVPMITENQTPDGTSTSESEKEGDYLDLDLDALGIDFNLSEFLKDFDFEGEGLCLSSQQRRDSSPDSHSGSPSTSGNIDMDSRQVTSQFSSTMAEFLGDKNMNLAGQDSITATRSVTQCIILSPVKSQINSLDLKNLHARN